MCNNSGIPPLQLACDPGRLDWLMVGNQNHDLLVTHNTGLPLHTTIWMSDKRRVIQLLDDAEADIYQEDARCKTPMHYCVTSGNIDLLRQILDRYFGAHADQQRLESHSPGLPSDLFSTALSQMCQFDFNDSETWPTAHSMCRLLLSEHKKTMADQAMDFTKVRGDFNKTHLIWAAELGRLREVQFLLQYESDIHSVDRFGETACHYADQFGHVEVIALLHSLTLLGVWID